MTYTEHVTQVQEGTSQLVSLLKAVDKRHFSYEVRKYHMHVLDYAKQLTLCLLSYWQAQVFYPLSAILDNLHTMVTNLNIQKTLICGI